MMKINKVKELCGMVEAPASKSYTHRALVAGALSNGRTILKKPLFCEDTLYTADGISQFGINVEKVNGCFEVHGKAGRLETPKNVIHIGNSGTTIRLLTTLAALANGGYTVLEGNARMNAARPIQYLLDGLNELGAEAFSTKNDGCPPVVVKGGGIKGGRARMKGDIDSQYFSSIMLAAPYARNDCFIEVIGRLVSRPYIDMTIYVINEFGGNVENKDYREFFVPKGQAYKAREFKIEGDYSSASYFFAAAAVTKGEVKVTNLEPDSKQGDKMMLKFLEDMGCGVETGEDYAKVIGKKLKGIEADMRDYPDIVQSLSVVAAFAEGKTAIRNVGHLEKKETDRLSALETELCRMGINAYCTDKYGRQTNAKEEKDGIVIEGGSPKGAVIKTYNDHRMAMSFAIAGLAIDNLVLDDEKCVNKSFPEYFAELEKLRCE